MAELLKMSRFNVILILFLLVVIAVLISPDGFDVDARDKAVKEITSLVIAYYRSNGSFPVCDGHDEISAVVGFGFSEDLPGLY